MGGRGASAAGKYGGSNNQNAQNVIATSNATQLKQQAQQQAQQAPVPKTAKTIDNISDLRSYAKQTLGIELGKSLDTIDYGLVQQAVSDYEFLKKEFPQWANTVTKLQTRNTKPGVNAQTDGTVITLSQQMYGNPQQFASKVSAAEGRHYYPKGTTNLTTAVHEMGHTFEQAMIDKIMPDDGSFITKYNRVDAWNKSVYSGKIISEAAKNAKQTPAGKGKLNSTLISDVSTYATKNRGETLAECVRDYYINRQNAQPLSKEVWKILKREFG